MATAWRESGLDLAKGMQFGRTRPAEDFVPGLRSDPHHAGQVALDVAEADGADQRREIVAAERPESGAAVGAGFYRHHQENGGARQRLNDRLCQGR